MTVLTDDQSFGSHQFIMLNNTIPDKMSSIHIEVVLKTVSDQVERLLGSYSDIDIDVGKIENVFHLDLFSKQVFYLQTNISVFFFFLLQVSFSI